LLLVALGAFGVGGLGFAGGFLVALGVLLALEFLAFAVAFVDLVVGAALRIGLGIVLVFVVVGGVGVLDLGVGDEVEVAQEFARRRREGVLIFDMVHQLGQRGAGAAFDLAAPEFCHGAARGRHGHAAEFFTQQQAK